MDKLQEARKIISEIDMEMADLFVRRMQAAVQVAEYKKERGLPIFDGARERELLEKGSQRVSDPALREHYVRFLQNNMDVSKDYQRQLLEGMKVAYSGTEGAFAHIAAGEIFQSARLVGYPNFVEAYRAVQEGACDCAVLPLENSSAGEVGQVMDMMFSGPLCVSGIYDLSVTHNLMAIPGTCLSDIEEVISHPQALSQCATYIHDHGFRQTQFENTARAAKYVAEQKSPRLAAIASVETAELYGLEIIKENINESDVNTTRFAVFSRVMNKSENDHSIIVFTVPDKAGALAHAINVIGHHGFNMRCIKSRAMKDLMWTYYFYVELGGNLQSRSGKYMLDELSDCCDRLKSIGTFNAENKI